MTALRDIVVVLDGSASSEARLATSIALAQQHQACLTGLSAFELLLPARPVVQPRSYEAVDTSPDASLLNLGAMRPLHYPETDTQIAERVEQIEGGVPGAP